MGRTIDPNRVQEIITVGCSCIPNQSIGGGKATTEFYPGKRKAVIAVVTHVLNDDPYWCVHWRGKHIVSVIIDGQQFGGQPLG